MWRQFSSRVWRGACCQWQICVKKSGVHCQLSVQPPVPCLHQQTVSLSLTTTQCKSFRKSKQKLYDLILTMPKKVDLKGLQEQRLARKKKIRKYPPSTVYLQVLGSGAPGAPKALYVFTEHAKYLFNCGEGTQRLAHEHKVKLSTMEHILITHKSWENVGGLPGMLLTLQDTGVPFITLHGPPGIASLYYDTRHFLRFKDISIQYKHFEENSGPSTDPLLIQAVPLWAKLEETVSGDPSEKMESFQETNDEGEDLYAHEKSVAKKRSSPVEESFNNPTLKRQKQGESTSCKNLSVAYICRPPPKAGALRLELCVKAGVPPGPQLGELKKGNDITLADGRIVKAADVTDPDDPGPVFIVVEAPSEAYLDSLLESSAFMQHQFSGGSEEDLAEVVVHFTPQEVVANPRYQEWMARFSPSTSHVIINDANSCMGSEAVHRIQYKLNHLNDNLFPLLGDNGIPKKEACTEGNAEESNNSDCKETLANNNEDTLQFGNSQISGVGPTVQAATLLNYYIRPKKRFDRSNVLHLCPDAYIQECYEGEKFESTFLDVKEKLQAPYLDKAVNAGSQDYPYVTFLGTGSCIPNKTRNTSGILLELSHDKALLMDCGEGTYGQLVRLLGSTECEVLLQKLVAVYVSHLHADHHIGLIRLLLARRRAFNAAGISNVPKLLLLAPSRIMAYLKSYNENFEPILEDFTIIWNQNLLYNDFTLGKEDYKKLCSQLDMKDISMTYVIHCPNSFGVAWSHVNGWKIVYSGDTMPCKGLVDIGKDCDILIHEATMEDELEEDARIKTHCTTSQAIQVGKDMNAQHTLLTHFSQRYAKVPLMDDLPAQVGIAFDNMKVCFRDLPTLHLLYDVLVAMFSENYDEMLEKTAKKRLARQKLEAAMSNITTNNITSEETAVKEINV
ncbi:ribonuclease Z, mitochondrial-like isoform X1 [Portunus trituberculatus]|uniref:ribonuclease Z, mitochondrial-like isoform X1 n=1 Tax=Portunus trituberculatus TaxID=210409 RepID=UPI001E1CCC16|nr:ribonuclease Z, mitochondrial-like isoform X1 [Portunus trituberculatus]